MQSARLDARHRSSRPFLAPPATPQLSGFIRNVCGSTSGSMAAAASSISSSRMKYMRVRVYVLRVEVCCDIYSARPYFDLTIHYTMQDGSDRIKQTTARTCKEKVKIKTSVTSPPALRPIFVCRPRLDYSNTGCATHRAV